MLLRAVAVALLLLGAGTAGAETWPTRPVRVVVPFAPGGGTDAVMRPMADRLSRALGQQFVIENRSGGAGVIGVEAAVRSPADGYTILATSSSPILVLPRLRKLPYDVDRDLVPVARMADPTVGLAVHPSVPARTVQELVALAKAQPGRFAFGSAGLGTTTHLYGELFRLRAAVEITHVPYKGSGESIADLLAGHIQIMFEAIVLPHVRAGKLHLLAVATDQRLAEFPDAPTMAEAGFADFEVPFWQGVMAPAGTPAAIVERLNAEIVKINRTPEMRDQLLAAGFLARHESVPEMAEHMRREAATVAQIITDAKISIE